MIKEAGAKAGVVLNPATPLSTLKWELAHVYHVMLMSVNPGFGGQQFIVSTLEKIRELKQMIEDQKLETLIEIDGGVNLNTIADISAAGTDVFVAGSAIFKSPDYAQTIADFKALMAE
jgi:ribulose-phosphate 3-epimerase